MLAPHRRADERSENQHRHTARILERLAEVGGPRRDKNTDQRFSVLPTPIPSATSTGAPDNRFATNAPTKMPGNAAMPNSNNAAIEIPLGGQTRVAKPEIAGERQPETRENDVQKRQP
jgi:hypothetical protein